jgi:2,4-dienoyl-CoA reductase-like NADH-dependent reductase (Old Yellow Enzyme family)
MPYKLSITSSLKANNQTKLAILAGFLLTPPDLILNQTIWFQPHHNIKYIKLFKQNLNIPVLAGSCFRNPKYMKKVIKNHEADMICMARPLIHNPYFPNEILGGSNDPSKCINCNLCLFLLPSGKPLKCYYGKAPS